jgi:RNA methyltransferase, TrmH family
MLTSAQNPLVKQIRRLHKNKARREEDLFLLEGSHLIEEACAVGFPLGVLCLTEDWQQRHGELFDRAAQQSDRVEFVTPDVLCAMATTVNPDGVLAIAQRPAPQTLTFKSFGLVLETIQDPGNLGTTIRTAAAAGVEGLILSDDSVDLDHPKVLRASAGQWFRLPMAVSGNLVQTVADYRRQGFQTIATLPQAKLSYWDVDLSKPTLVLMGNEGAGLSAQLADLADHQVSIPLAPGVESLNVGVCTALMLYEVRRQRRRQ